MEEQELVNNISPVCHLSYRDMTLALFISTRQTFVLVSEAHIQSTQSPIVLMRSLHSPVQTSSGRWSLVS